MRPIRISILIPNFNNGTQSSKSGQDNLLENLLRSLASTLHDDPTPLELIAYDDGSTDDSLATLRVWSKRTWPDGRPFLELIEAEHCGYLSRVANILSRRARGDILVRLDGDIVCLTPRWAQKLCDLFDHGPERIGVIAPKQLRSDGKIHAFGDMVISPTGYSHVASGMDRDAVRHMLQVDHAMGCFYCCRKQVFDDVGGYDENFLRGQTEDIGLRALLKGWKCFAVPDIEYAHLHTMRRDRETEADSDEGISKTIRIFQAKWGFCRLASDLDAVRKKYAGTGLLWNKRLFPDGEGAVGDDRVTRASRVPIRVEESEWARYTSDPAVQTAVNLRVTTALDLAGQVLSSVRPVMLGAGQGLVPHLMAMRGVSCRAFDERANHVELAQRCIAGHQYTCEPPTVELLSDVRRVPLPDQSVDLLMIVDLLERHPNPVALLREAERLLAPGRILLIVMKRKRLDLDPSDPANERAVWGEHRYMWPELITQVQAMVAWRFVMDVKRDDASHDPFLVCQRVAYTKREFDLTHIEPVIPAAEAVGA
ncbi:MAG: glycosyltransferase [Planctomycetes bacterium]|nr:glycosyltransferase [Planctomycetota bacterium]